MTTTGALGTQADIVIYSLVRNNLEGKVGTAGTLQDVNVAISRAKEKLIIIGNFDMMLNGWSILPPQTRYSFKNPARHLTRLIDSKYGKVIICKWNKSRQSTPHSIPCCKIKVL